MMGKPFSDVLPEIKRYYNKRRKARIAAGYFQGTGNKQDLFDVTGAHRQKARSDEMIRTGLSGNALRAGTVVLPADQLIRDDGLYVFLAVAGSAFLYKGPDHP